MMDRQELIELIKSKARVVGHDAWEGGYYHLANAEEIADAILAPKPPPVPTVTCRSCNGTGADPSLPSTNSGDFGMTDRNPYDGRPFYCQNCGAGLSEYLACELPQCELETPQQAQARRTSQHPSPQDRTP